MAIPIKQFTRLLDATCAEATAAIAVRQGKGTDADLGQAMQHTEHLMTECGWPWSASVEQGDWWDRYLRQLDCRVAAGR